MGDQPALALLESRHVDALTEALHVNARLLTQQAQRDAEQAKREVRILAVLERVAVATERVVGATERAATLLEKVAVTLPALVDQQVPTRTNGASHHEENDDERTGTR